MDPTAINLIILDVDGVLTDGRVTTSPDGDVAKGFHVHDGCALKLWQRSGGKVAILSGREGRQITQRASELGIEWVRMGVVNKSKVYTDLLALADCEDQAVAYVGDDLPDLGPMSRCGIAVAVANAVGPVKRAADYVTRRGGGSGAVAEVVEWLLRKKGLWSREALLEM